MDAFLAATRWLVGVWARAMLALSELIYGNGDPPDPTPPPSILDHEYIDPDDWEERL